MNNEHNKSQIENTEKLKEIPKWTRKYAQNRTLTILVFMVILLLIASGIAFVVGFPLALTEIGFRKGNIVLSCVGISVLVAALAAILIMLIIFISKFGGKNRGLIEKLIDQRIYGNEVTLSLPKSEPSKKKILLDVAVAIIGLIGILGSWYLGMENFIQRKYMQPISALFLVPCIVFSWYFFRSPRMGPIYLLFPILYAIHAILIIVGVPLFFTGNFGAIFNIALPYLGYSFLPYIIGHVYSRYALKKLKGITHLEGNTANGD